MARAPKCENIQIVQQSDSRLIEEDKLPSITIIDSV